MSRIGESSNKEKKEKVQININNTLSQAIIFQGQNQDQNIFMPFQRQSGKTPGSNSTDSKGTSNPDPAINSYLSNNSNKQNETHNFPCNQIYLNQVRELKENFKNCLIQKDFQKNQDKIKIDGMRQNFQQSNQNFDYYIQNSMNVEKNMSNKFKECIKKQIDVKKTYTQQQNTPQQFQKLNQNEDLYYQFQKTDSKFYQKQNRNMIDKEQYENKKRRSADIFKSDQQYNNEQSQSKKHGTTCSFVNVASVNGSKRSNYKDITNSSHHIQLSNQINQQIAQQAQNQLQNKIIDKMASQIKLNKEINQIGPVESVIGSNGDEQSQFLGRDSHMSLFMITQSNQKNLKQQKMINNCSNIQEHKFQTEIKERQKSIINRKYPVQQQNYEIQKNKKSVNNDLKLNFNQIFTKKQASQSPYLSLDSDKKNNLTNNLKQEENKNFQTERVARNEILQFESEDGFIKIYAPLKINTSPTKNKKQKTSPSHHTQLSSVESNQSSSRLINLSNKQAIMDLQQIISEQQKIIREQKYQYDKLYRKYRNLKDVKEKQQNICIEQLQQKIDYLQNMFYNKIDTNISLNFFNNQNSNQLIKNQGNNQQLEHIQNIKQMIFSRQILEQNKDYAFKSQNLQNEEEQEKDFMRIKNDKLKIKLYDKINELGQKYRNKIQNDQLENNDNFSNEIPVKNLWRWFKVMYKLWRLQIDQNHILVCQ